MMATEAANLPDVAQGPPQTSKYSYTSETDWYVDCMWRNLFLIKICGMYYVLC